MSAYLRPFKHYSSYELLNLLLVSKMTAYPKLMKNTDTLMNISSSIIGPKATSFYVGKLIGNVFSAGESLPDLKSVLNQLSSINQGIVIDYCAEGVTSESGMNETLQQIESAIELSSKYQNSSVSIKLTSLIPETTLKKLNLLEQKHNTSIENLWQESIFHSISEGFLRNEGFSERSIKETFNGLERIRKICKDCENQGISVMIDAEQSYFQYAIDGITALVQKESNGNRAVVLNTIQSYLTNSSDKLKGYLDWTTSNKIKPGIKLVRGAYMKEENGLALNFNRESPVHKSRSDTDRCYNYNLKLILSSLSENCEVCVATHNKESIYFAKELMGEFRVNRLYGGVKFAQLLGMKSMISAYLTREHYVVQKYTPYGPFDKLMPYLGRRAQEMNDMVADIDNQIEMIIEELKIRSN